MNLRIEAMSKMDTLTSFSESHAHSHAFTVQSSASETQTPLYSPSTHRSDMTVGVHTRVRPPPYGGDGKNTHIRAEIPDLSNSSYWSTPCGQMVLCPY
ncbi:MAG: hypothetical protein J07HQX50_00392 [Haloquadratum sp. J07HQX50]|nr:MAG: hypothetical protein J07HQX50_00392 [Haloquadratum sp. J07HQX50]